MRRRFLDCQHWMALQPCTSSRNVVYKLHVSDNIGNASRWMDASSGFCSQPGFKSSCFWHVLDRKHVKQMACATGLKAYEGVRRQSNIHQTVMFACT